MVRSRSEEAIASCCPSKACISGSTSSSSAGRRCGRSRDPPALRAWSLRLALSSVGLHGYNTADTLHGTRHSPQDQSMIHLEIAGERYPIAAGETVRCSASDNSVVLAREGVHPQHAVIQGAQSGSAAIRPAAADAEVRVNGVRLGAEPTPLLHGDKIVIG